MMEKNRALGMCCSVCGYLGPKNPVAHEAFERAVTPQEMQLPRGHKVSNQVLGGNLVGYTKVPMCRPCADAINQAGTDVVQIRREEIT